MYNFIENQGSIQGHPWLERQRYLLSPVEPEQSSLEKKFRLAFGNTQPESSTDFGTGKRTTVPPRGRQ